ncbi:MAG: DUF4179 domain-containing protein [Anaerolineae bacterium]|nr:DUF4179 domain-containing protein [Thermoflexus sp.]MDW8065584.1 DUF4179 domain-containing protein [Anaerolineae bacterium]
MDERSEFPRNVAEEAQLREGLDQIARSRVPSDRDLWPALQARLFPSASRPAWWWRRAPGWAWRTAGLMLVLALAGMAYAPSLWEAFFSTRLLEQGGKLQALSLSQTRDGITVTVERAYADANRIVIGYRVQGLPVSSGISRHPQLTLEDPEGRRIPELIGEGLVGASEALGAALPPGEIGGAVSFDPWELPGWPFHRPGMLSLRLRVAFLPVPQEGAAPGAMHFFIPSQTAPTETPSALSAEPPPSAPSFVFDLKVPVVSEAEIYGPQTVRAHGLDLTLARWVRAPSGIRARVCFVPPDPSLVWTAIVEQGFATGLEVAPNVRMEGTVSGRALTVTAPILMGPFTWRGEQTCQDVFLDIPGGMERDRGGRVVFRVTEVIGWDPQNPEPAVRWPGPWEFSLSADHQQPSGP